MPRRRIGHPEVDAVLERLVSGARGVLGEHFVGAYLLGSFATGDADPHSDVDFAIATEDDVPAEREPALQEMHGALYDAGPIWARRLDGSYIPKRILRRPQPGGALLLYLDNGSRRLVRSAHCNRLVIRKLIRERGITLAGPDAAQLIDPVPRDALCAEIAADMRAWAHEIHAEPAAMDNRHYQPYAVLSYCRMLYTLETGAIASKPEAASWALATLDPEWCGLIERALAQRPDPEQRFRQRADPQDFERTLRFIEYALRFPA